MADETLAALRSLMLSHSPPLDALVVPSEDYHQSEYVSARDKRREFVSGFTGSAGLALILANEALLWTDGRYFLQAETQLSNQWKLMRIGEDPAVDIWMADNLPSDAAIGVDPWCISVDTAQKWELAFAKKQQNLIKTTTNLVDEVWLNRPPSEENPVVLHPLEFAGRSVEDKLMGLREDLMREKARAIILTALDEVAWIYNVRGSDVSYCPVVHAYAIVTSAAAFFYVDKRKVSSEVRSYMEKNGIKVKDYGDVSSDAALLASDQLISTNSAKGTAHDISENSTAGNENSAEDNKNDLIWVDPGSCCVALYTKLNSDEVFLQSSPLALAKARKNPIEIEGLKNAHIRDGAAVVQYLVWLDKRMQEIYRIPSKPRKYYLVAYWRRLGCSYKKSLLLSKFRMATATPKDENPIYPTDFNLTPPSTEDASPAQQPLASVGDSDESKGKPVATETSEKIIDVDGGDSVTDIQKKMKRAERFGVPVHLSEEEKRNSRAERFGTGSDLNGLDSSKQSEELKKAGGERFGVVQATPADEEVKKKARLARFGSSSTDSAEEDKKKARARRFSQPDSNLKANGEGDIKVETTIAGKAGG